MHLEKKEGLFSFKFKSVNIFFTTREGGLSKKPFNSFNLGPVSGDLMLKKNYNILLQKLSLKRGITLIKQVHGIDIVRVTKKKAYIKDKSIPLHLSEDFLLLDIKGDGIYTEEKSLPVGIYTADCLPLILTDNKSFILLLHCGWRGIYRGIIEKGLSFLLSNKKKANYLILGPAIEDCCFIFEDKESKFHPSSFRKYKGKTYLSLKKEAEFRVRKIVKDIKTVKMKYCTFCNEKLFFSYKRDGIKTGRQLTVGIIQ